MGERDGSEIPGAYQEGAVITRDNGVIDDCEHHTKGDTRK